MKLGTHWIDITPAEPIDIYGQMSVRRGEYTHDPLTVNAVALEQDGVKVVLVSCDMCQFEDAFVRQVQSMCEESIGVPASSVLIACTHTHLAPNTFDTLFGKANQAFLDGLRKSLVEVVRQSLDDLEEVELYAGSGWLEQMGFNRRGLYGNGRAEMYHGSWNENFVGVEGPRDGEVGVIFARRPSGDIKAVIPSFSTHPNSLELEAFYSADLVGAVRSFLRRNLGDDLGVIYLTGAAGNTAPSKLDDNKDAEMPWRSEDGWERSGLYLGSEILKTIAGTIKPMQDPVLRLAQATLAIPLGQWREAFDPGEMVLRPDFEEWFEYVRKQWPKVLEERNPTEVRVNVLRIGDAIICTSPAELFVEYGLQIKETSPASVTIVAELVDGCVGYVPTEEAMKHGGYCSIRQPACPLDVCAGGMIVDATRQLIDRVLE
jgi:neutral ceramidase